MRLQFLLFLIILATVRADWWDSLTDKVADGFTGAATWVKEKASPTIREKFNDAKETLQDPETHKTVREWLADKADRATEFAQTEVIPELKKIYEAAVHDDTTAETTDESTTVEM